LQGGHSGVDIHEQRGNANVLLARTLGILRKSADFRLVDLTGGSAHNAIPREAGARLAVKAGDRRLATRLEEWRAELLRAFPHEPGLEVTLTEMPAAATAPEVLTTASTDKAVDLLLAAPDGVMAMSKRVPGLVETSVNLATIRTAKGQLAVLFSQRSDRGDGLDWLTARLTALARLAGGRLGVSGGYPGWQPEPDSPLLARAKRIYRAEFGREPRIEVIHAGLECGLIGAKNPGLEMLSLGPTVKNPHSPREKLHLPSLERSCRLLAALLASYTRPNDDSQERLISGRAGIRSCGRLRQK
jgi:dipeptidase D